MQIEGDFEHRRKETQETPGLKLECAEGLRLSRL